MRRYDDPVEVRRGLVSGPGGPEEGPEQFLWRGRLWKVHDVMAHWIETGAWWRSPGARAVLGSDGPESARTAGVTAGAGVSSGAGVPGRPGGSDTAVAVQAPLYGELVAEREVWRVEAGRGLAAADAGRGVFDLTFDWADGSWRLTRCSD